MSALKIKLRGSGRVHFTTTKQVTVRDSDGKSTTKTETVHHRSSEEYVDQEAVLFHGPELGVGHHIFPFTLFLGPNLPSSFEGQYGNVRYHIQGVIVRDWLWNHRTKVHVTVNSILDLNEYPACIHPGQTGNHKTFCCLCCRSGPLSTRIHTNKQGYVPGEYIIFSAEVDNQSNKAGGHQKIDKRVVAKMHRGKIDAGESEMWDRVAILVPPLPPSFLGHGRPCGIIHITYTLKFTVTPEGVGFSLKSKIPITIGTIPLRNMFNQIQQSIPGPPGGFSDGQFGGFSSAPPLPDSFNSYMDLPPPTYAESVWGQVNVRDVEDDENCEGSFEFAPRYPTYNFLPPQPSAPPQF